MTEAVMPTYGVLVTRGEGRVSLVDVPTKNRIVKVFPPVKGRAFYGEALELAQGFRCGGGYAIVVDMEYIERYEPK